MVECCCNLIFEVLFADIMDFEDILADKASTYKNDASYVLSYRVISKCVDSIFCFFIKDLPSRQYF